MASPPFSLSAMRFILIHIRELVGLGDSWVLTTIFEPDRPYGWYGMIALVQDFIPVGWKMVEYKFQMRSDQ